jgi:uridylate kinase
MEKRRVWVISLGGSRIVPEEVDSRFIEHFKELIIKHPSQKFVVVTGGGSTARKYIHAMKNLKGGAKKQSLEGIAITRFHADFLARVLGKRANEKIPKSMKEVKEMLEKNQVVFCGALRWKPKETSDGTSAELASFLKAPFINITNVRGLYTSNPKTSKTAKFIKRISWKDFHKKAEKIKFHAGQHFVLDQNASRIIMEKRIPTYITGSLQDIDKIVSGKKFQGSLISG